MSHTQQMDSGMVAHILKASSITNMNLESRHVDRGFIFKSAKFQSLLVPFITFYFLTFGNGSFHAVPLNFASMQFISQFLTVTYS